MGAAARRAFNRLEAEKLWPACVKQLQLAGCRFRLYRNRRSPFIWVKEVDGAAVLARFSVAPLRLDDPGDLREAVARCERCHVLGHWPQAERAGDGASGGWSWFQLARAIERQVVDTIPKEGSRVHLVNDLRRRIALLPGRPSAAALRQWVLEVDAAQAPRSYNRRLEVISQIQRSGVLDLAGLLEELRALRPRGAAVRLARARHQRVRVVPLDQAIEDWLDQLDGFNRWVFGVLSCYGLRPHELWHVHPPDSQGWVTVPGDMLTKSARAHSAPPVLRRWLERYQLAEQWPQRQRELAERWPVRWKACGGVMVPVNNAALGQYLYKQFTLRGLARLEAPLEGGGVDWCRPYDLRHAYAIRCATSAETASVLPEQQAEWLGHSWDVHQRIYLKWLPAGRKRRAMQAQLAGELDSGERQELERLRQQMAAMQQLLTQASSGAS